MGRRDKQAAELENGEKDPSVGANLSFSSGALIAECGGHSVLRGVSSRQHLAYWQATSIPAVAVRACLSEMGVEVADRSLCFRARSCGRTRTFESAWRLRPDALDIGFPRASPERASVDA